MTEILEKNQPGLSIKRAHGRVINVVADLLRKQLHIPNVYLNPKISGIQGVDVLAVDRAGSGDIHVIEIKILAIFPTRSQLRALLKPIQELPFHYKYLALPGFSTDLSDAKKFSDYAELFDDSGIGRIGIISFDSRILHISSIIDSSSVALTVRPERFRVNSDQLTSVEKFLAKAKPDMEVRI